MNRAAAHVVAASRGSRARAAWLVMSIVAALVLLATATGGLGAKARQVTGGAATPAHAAGPASDADNPITGQFTRFALNALLVPLIDDAEPPRWTDVAMRYFCGPATHVEVDGHPLVPGAAVPATAFTVRWHIDRCWPLDYAAIELSGTVDLQVAHDAAGLSAIVSAQRLRVSTARGSGVVDQPFAASMVTGSSRSLSLQ